MPQTREAVRSHDQRAGAEHLERSIRVEASILVVVLALTGFLVDRSPQSEVAAAERSRNPVQTATLQEVRVSARMTPLLQGTNTVTIDMVDAAGSPFEGFEAPKARLSSGDMDLGEIGLINVGPGSYTAQVVLPIDGIWELRLSLRTTEFDNPVTTVQFPVKSG